MGAIYHQKPNRHQGLAAVDRAREEGGRRERAPKRNGGWCRHQPPLSQVQVADAQGQRLVSLGRFGSAREVAFARFPCSKTLVARTPVSPGGFLEASGPLRSGLAPWSFASRRLPPPSRLCFAALHPCGIRAVPHRLMAWSFRPSPVDRSGHEQRLSPFSESRQAKSTCG